LVLITGIHGGTKAREINVEEPGVLGMVSPHGKIPNSTKSPLSMVRAGRAGGAA
jgi:hypothetical protein